MAYAETWTETQEISFLNKTRAEFGNNIQFQTNLIKKSSKDQNIIMAYTTQPKMNFLLFKLWSKNNPCLNL